VLSTYSHASRNTEWSSDEFATQLLKKEKLAVVPGNAFGDCGEGFLRLSYAYSIEQLREAMSRIKHFLENL
jgi:Aspartate/tyrosine/aromatic aminotransferase